MSQTKSQNIPVHVGLIIDGNRRWAKKHGLPPWEGHMAGMAALEEVVREFVERGVPYISFYTWSTENWKRAEAEVKAFMRLLRRMFKSELKRLLQEDCRFVALGDRSTMPGDILKMIETAEFESKNGKRATLVMCFNYGGQQEIVHAVNRLLARGQSWSKDMPHAGGSSTPAEVSVEDFAEFLDHPEVPPLDLIVRTSGEQRLSNFMLWRSAYAELLFLDKHWPDMRASDVAGILDEYNRRNRRHGG